jgi:hypothetical protein
MKITLNDMKECIFMLGMENTTHLNMDRVKEYLDLVKRKKAVYSMEKIFGTFYSISYVPN